MNPTSNAVAPAIKARLRRRLFLFTGTIALLAVIFFCAPPAYRAFKRWRSDRLAAQSERFINRDEWTQAQAKAQGAYLLAPTRPAALRALARVLTHATNAAALPLWQQLGQIGQITERDRQTCVELAVRVGATDTAVNEVQRLLARAPNDATNLWLASQIFILLGDRDRTVYYATRARLHAPGNQRFNLFLSSLRFDAPEPDQRAEARTNVWSLAGGSDQIGLEALDFLARRPELTADQRQQLIARLQQHPLGGVSRQFQILNQRVRLTPERRAEILDQAVARYKTSPPEVRQQFAVWLNQNGEFERTLAVVPLAEAYQRKDFFLPHIDALASLGRWEALQKILGTQQAPLEEVYSEAFRARSALQSSNAPSAEFYWRGALRSAERNPEQLWWLAGYAEKCGVLDVTKKTLRALIGCSQDARAPYRALAKLTDQSGTTGELCDVVGEMQARWPGDIALRNDRACLNLLLGRELPESRQTAEALVQQFPDSLVHRTTLALAWYRLKDFPAALRVYAGRPYDWQRASLGQRAVYAAVLAANDKVAEARALAHTLSRGDLRPEEFELIRPLQ